MTDGPRSTPSWLVRARAAFDDALTPLRAAIIGAPVVLFVGVIAIAVIAFSLGGEDVRQPDPGSPTFAADLADRLGAEPAEITSGVLEGLLGSDLTTEEREAMVASLAELLGGPDGGTQGSDAADEAVLNALVRRLSARASEIESSDELVALLIAEIDPDGSIDSPEELVAAIEKWAAEQPANVLRIVAPSAASVGPLLGVTSASYEEIAGLLEDYRLAADVFDLPLAGVTGIEPLAVQGVVWEADPGTRSVVFTGTTTLFDRPVELLAIAHWGEADSPSLTIGLRTDDWSLDGFGVSGPLGDYLFPEITFVLAGDEVTLPLASVPDSAASFLTPTISADAEALSFVSGLNLLATLPLDTLPEEALRALGLTADNSLVALSGTLGADFAIMSGGAVAEPTRLALTATLPPIEPPSFPDWLTQPDGAAGASRSPTPTARSRSGSPGRSRLASTASGVLSPSRSTSRRTVAPRERCAASCWNRGTTRSVSHG